MRAAILRAGAGALFLAVVPLASGDPGWMKIDPGLEWGEFTSPLQAVGAAKILVVRADPARYQPCLLCISREGKNARMRSIREWAREFGLAAAINAGMFQADYRTHVGYLKDYAHVNNPRVNQTYLSVAAFNPRKPGLPPFMIFDIDGGGLGTIPGEYHTVIQNLRLIRRPAVNTWPASDRKWSEAALGQDKEGRILFIFSRYPHAMHDFVRVLLALPIGIQCAQHLEGGPEASLYLRRDGGEIVCTGSYETGFNENDGNDRDWPLPNVIGLVKKRP